MWRVVDFSSFYHDIIYLYESLNIRNLYMTDEMPWNWAPLTAHLLAPRSQPSPPFSALWTLLLILHTAFPDPLTNQLLHKQGRMKEERILFLIWPQVTFSLAESICSGLSLQLFEHCQHQLYHSSSKAPKVAILWPRCCLIFAPHWSSCSLRFILIWVTGTCQARTLK